MPATNKRFIAYDETAIFGSGTTPEQALEDVRRRNNATRRTEIGKLPERSLETAPATAARGVRGTRRPTGVGRAVRRHPLYARRGERRRTRRTRLRSERSGNLRGAPRLIRSRDEHTSSAPCHAVPTVASSPRLPSNPYSGLRRSAREAPAGLPRSEGSDSRSASTTLSRRAIRSGATSAATARRFRSSRGSIVHPRWVDGGDEHRTRTTVSGLVD